MSDEHKSSGLSKAANFAQLARGIAETIKGGMAGGLHGAAIAAVKNFAPQLIKLVAIILTFLLILPPIIFFSLPHAYFQWSSVSNGKAFSMSSQSKLIESLYSQIDGFTQDEADKIISSLSLGFDDVIVERNFGNIKRTCFKLSSDD